jgi:hypothetical protein
MRTFVCRSTFLYGYNYENIYLQARTEMCIFCKDLSFIFTFSKSWEELEQFSLVACCTFSHGPANILPLLQNILKLPANI